MAPDWNRTRTNNKLKPPMAPDWNRTRTNNKLKPPMAPDWNRTRATLVGDERAHQCAISVPQILDVSY